MRKGAAGQRMTCVAELSVYTSHPNHALKADETSSWKGSYYEGWPDSNAKVLRGALSAQDDGIRVDLAVLARTMTSPKTVNNSFADDSCALLCSHGHAKLCLLC